jgi:outer membrane protein TolC
VPEIPSLAGFDNPVDTLRRRPDVITAERRVAASNERIGAALAGYYPTISLSAILGSESIAPGHLFQTGSFQPQAMAGLRWRILDFGKVNAEVAQARGANAEALINYRRTVLHAAEDVEDAFMTLSIRSTRGRGGVRSGRS